MILTSFENNKSNKDNKMYFSLYRNLKHIILCGVIICFSLLGLACGEPAEDFVGTVTKDETQFILQFQKFKGMKSHIIPFIAGDEIDVSMVRTTGDISVKIGLADESKRAAEDALLSEIYVGDSVSTSAFQVVIPEDGNYRIVATSTNGSGALMFKRIAHTENGNSEETTEDAAEKEDEKLNEAETDQSEKEHSESNSGKPVEPDELIQENVGNLLGNTQETADEFLEIMNYISEDVKPGIAGVSVRTIRAAARLNDWSKTSNCTEGFAKGLMRDYLASLKQSQKVVFLVNFSTVYEYCYNLTAGDVKETLRFASVEKSKYPWDNGDLIRIDWAKSGIK